MTISTETAGQTLTCSATSTGGTSSKSVTIKLDKTAPSASLAVTTGTSGANGWYTSDVTVSTTGSDTISSPVTCTPTTQSLTSESTGTVFNGSCTNDAGLTTSAAALTVKLDKSGPSASLAAVGTLGDNGWYTSDVTVTTTGSDSISSPVTCSDDQPQITDTTGTVFNGSCTNNAGLPTNATALTVKRDATKPAVSLTGGPSDGGSYYFGSVPAAPTCDASDATSGSGSATCSVSGFSTAVESHTVTATAKDNAGNENSASASYDRPCLDARWVLPAGRHGRRVNTVKSGSTVPLKFEVFAGATELRDISVVDSVHVGLRPM